MSLKNPWLWAFLAGVVLLTAIRPLLRRDPPPPPVVGHVPPFRLIDSQGQPFGSDRLEDGSYVVSFFTTRCEGSCPRVMRAMKRLQEVSDEARVRGVRLVSVTLDPGFDTPERLSAYGASLGVRPERWTLLTGDAAEIRRLAALGFRIAATEEHATRLFLVDPAGDLRGSYGTDDLGLEELYGRARQLSQGGRKLVGDPRSGSAGQGGRSREARTCSTAMLLDSVPRPLGRPGAKKASSAETDRSPATT